MLKSRLFSKGGAVNRDLIVLSIWKGLEPEHADSQLLTNHILMMTWTGRSVL